MKRRDAYLVATFTVLVLSAVGLAYAAEIPLVHDALDAGTRADKLGIVGILTTCLIVSMCINVWFILADRVEFKKLLERVLAGLGEATIAARDVERALKEWHCSANSRH